jgi:hypothetical protein
VAFFSRALPTFHSDARSESASIHREYVVC